MDLVASRLLVQLPQYITCKLDPYSQGTDQYLYAFPLISMIKKRFKKDSSGPSNKNFHCSSHMTVSSLAPNLSENVSKETTCYTTSPTSSIEPPGSDTSINKEQNITITGLDGFRQKLLEAGISDSVSKLFQVQGEKPHYQITIRHPQKGPAGEVKEKFTYFDGL